MTHRARDGERRPEGRWQLSPHTGAPAGSSRPLGFQDILAEHDESLSQIKEISSLVPRLFEDRGFGSTEVSGVTQQVFLFFLTLICQGVGNSGCFCQPSLHSPSHNSILDFPWGPPLL